jgi:hypothetical protein
VNAFATFQIVGVVRAVTITERGQRRFKVAEILVELSEEDAVQVEATHERLGAAQRLAEGDVVVISGYVRSRKGGERWFTSLSALVIAVATGSQVGKPTASTKPAWPQSAAPLQPEDPGQEGTDGGDPW